MADSTNGIGSRPVWHADQRSSLLERAKQFAAGMGSSETNIQWPGDWLLDESETRLSESLFAQSDAANIDITPDFHAGNEPHDDAAAKVARVL